MRRVCIHVFGCQMNKLDGELVAEALSAAGDIIVPNEEDADTILFITCSVRDHAEQRVLSRVAQLRARKENEPELLIGILGCMAQRMGQDLLETNPEIDLVCGTRQFPHIHTLLQKAEGGPVIATQEDPLTAPGAATPHARTLHNGAFAFVSVMRGCNNFCSYCIVPYVRGREESRSIEDVVEEVRAVVDQGAKEVTLLGQNIDAYGKDIGTNLSALLRAVHTIDGLLRIRFVSSHPRDITRELIQTIHELPKVCPHLHMAAQSGSSRILKAMNRGYTREIWDEKIAAIRELAPETLVISDFIVGFPGETEEDFLQTKSLIEDARLQNAFVFKYSPRPGTVSARTMVDDVSAEEKKRRNVELLAVQERINRERNEGLIGSTQEILVEGVSHRDARRMSGRTGSNLICVFPTPENPEAWIGKLVTITIDSATPLTLYGTAQSTPQG